MDRSIQMKAMSSDQNMAALAPKGQPPRMWAVIGMYGGQEDNAFYRRRPGGNGIEPAGGAAAGAAAVSPLSRALRRAAVSASTGISVSLK